MPPTNDNLSCVVSTRLSQTDLAAINKLTKGQKRKLSTYIRFLIKKGLKDLENKKIG
jgi:predicted DNA-binding protein